MAHKAPTYTYKGFATRANSLFLLHVSYATFVEFLLSLAHTPLTPRTKCCHFNLLANMKIANFSNNSEDFLYWNFKTKKWWKNCVSKTNCAHNSLTTLLPQRKFRQAYISHSWLFPTRDSVFVAYLFANLSFAAAEFSAIFHLTPHRRAFTSFSYSLFALSSLACDILLRTRTSTSHLAATGTNQIHIGRH